ncbi:MAG: hypothetical protein M3520_04155 [Actinomycetota bacterium]|nr:hypothetical protein [Actinomycetota bacterium]
MTTFKTIRGEATRRADDATAQMTRQAQTWTTEAGRIASDPTPVYAVVGVTDAVVERARAAGETLARLRKQLSPLALSHQVGRRAEGVTKQVEAVPSAAFGEAVERVGQLQQGYQGLATRGQGLVGRVRGQQTTKDLMAQVDNAVMQGRKLLTTARRGATETRTAARATVTTGRRQAADVTADAIAGEEMTTTPASRTAAKAAPRKTSTRKPAARKSATSKSATSKSATTKSATTKSATTKSATTGAASKSASPKSTTKRAGANATSKRAATPAAGNRPGTSTSASSKPATRTAAKRTASTATSRTAETATAAKAAATSVSKTAERATDAATDTAAKVGN